MSDTDYEFYCPSFSNPLVFYYKYLLSIIEKERNVDIGFTPYESNYIEYQYKNEPLKKIYALQGGTLTYKLTDVEVETCAGQRYRIFFKTKNAIFTSNYGLYAGKRGYRCDYLNNEGGNYKQFWGPIEGFRLAKPAILDSCVGLDSPKYAPAGVKQGFNDLEVLCYGFGNQPLLEANWFSVYIDGYYNPSAILTDLTIDYWIEKNGTCPPKCKFEVFENNEILYSEIREDCPEVKIFPCYLNHEKSKNRSAFLGENDLFVAIPGKLGLLNPAVDAALSLAAFQVRGIAINPAIFAQLVGLGMSNPEECVLFVRIENFGFIQILDQVCSSVGCPLPLYNVTCKPQKESCPSDTCAIVCGDVVCCYDDQGIAIKTIDINSYQGT